jgi:NitT/TauT family transport system permease protein
MDVILPYVAWISLLAVMMDVTLAWISRRFFPWDNAKGAE